jgi:hypothetical protein
MLSSNETRHRVSAFPGVWRECSTCVCNQPGKGDIRRDLHAGYVLANPPLNDSLAPKERSPHVEPGLVHRAHYEKALRPVAAIPGSTFHLS